MLKLAALLLLHHLVVVLDSLKIHLCALELYLAEARGCALQHVVFGLKVLLPTHEFGLCFSCSCLEFLRHFFVVVVQVYEAIQTNVHDACAAFGDGGGTARLARHRANGEQGRGREGN